MRTGCQILKFLASRGATQGSASTRPPPLGLQRRRRRNAPSTGGGGLASPPFASPSLASLRCLQAQDLTFIAAGHRRPPELEQNLRTSSLRRTSTSSGEYSSMSPSSSSGEEEEDQWVPPSRRPELADVEPTPQDDGPCPVVLIAYRDDFREVMDYFRALYFAGELSLRALRLTADAIHFNPGNYSVWHFRRLVLEALDADLLQEMTFVDQITESNPKNYQVWHHKRWLAEKLGPEVANSEHEFTRKILVMDAKNYHAWSHRQWVLQALGGWESELEYSNQLLEEDVFNNSAWNQRYLVITRSPLLGGLAAMRDSEVDYTLEVIMANPQNESPWRYLRGLYKGENNLLVSDDRISDVCLKVLKNGWSCVFALSFLLDLLRIGLRPSDELEGIIKEMKNSDPETAHADLATTICSLLQKCDPLRINYWSWYQTTLSS